MERVPGAVERGDAQPEEAAASVLEISGEVLSAHARQPDLFDVGRPDDLAGGLDTERRDLRIVEDRIGPAEEDDIDRAAAGRRQSPRDLGDPLLHLRRRAVAEGPDR